MVVFYKIFRRFKPGLSWKNKNIEKQNSTFNDLCFVKSKFMLPVTFLQFKNNKQRKRVSMHIMKNI